MRRAFKNIITLLVPVLFSAVLINIVKLNNYTKDVTLKTKDDITYETISQSLLKDVTLESAGVFLYTNDYKTRYVFAANTEILNPIADIEYDSFFTTLLKYNKQGVCTVIKTSNVPTDSSLYISLKEKDKISEDWFYIACPIFTKGGALAGYLSSVFENDDQISVYLQQVNYYTKLVENNLENII